MSSPKSLILLATVAAGLTLLAVPPAFAQRNSEHTEPVGDLQQALENAQTSAKGADNLDAAYDLLGVAGAAQARGMKAIADKATAGFEDLVQRTSANALRKGGALASDTLDQLVDLRFFARSQEVTKAMAVLDTAMRSLFPAVSQALQQQIDSAQNWDDRVEALNDLASLQASAAQVLMNDIAAAIAQAFEGRMATLQAAADQATDDAERARRVAALVEAKRSREEQLADASANNVESVADQLKATGKSEESARGTTGEDIPPDLMGETSCIETGYRGGTPDAKTQRAHDRECVNSGRVPTASRCSTANLSMACYVRLPNGEKITYVYRNTPEESYFRSKCGKDDLVPANKIPQGGAAFRSRDVSLAYVCAPTGEPTAD